MNTKPILKTLAAIFGVAGGCLLSSLAHAELFVISNSATSIAAGEIKEVFTGDKQLAGSAKLVPVDNASAQESFLSTALKMDVSRYNTIWTKKSFRDGLTAPAVKSGDAEVLDFVRKTAGAVGYVNSQPSGVNIIQKY